MEKPIRKTGIEQDYVRDGGDCSETSPEICEPSTHASAAANLHALCSTVVHNVGVFMKILDADWESVRRTRPTIESKLAFPRAKH